MPPLPDLTQLAAWCREVGEVEQVQPWTVEKDFHLTRALWALAEQQGPELLLKGGTCLSKVDLGYHRMSEDIDMIVPGHPSRYRKTNFERLNPIARSLEGFRSALSLELESFDGTRTDAGSHAIWDLNYDSKLLQPASITVEVSIRPLHRPARRVPLRQLLPESLVAGYGDAYCWALDFAEVRAEKVRAAFTRVDPQIRDYYDLGLLAAGGADMSSPPFRALVDAKLAEVGASSLSQQARSFGLDTHRREVLAASSKLLAGMVRSNEPPFNLDAVLAHYDALWA